MELGDIVMNCVIDCRENEGACNKFLTLNFDGGYIMQRAIDAALEADMSRPVYVLTNSDHIARLCGKIYPEEVRVIGDIGEVSCPKLIISGRAPFIKAKRLNSILNDRDGGNMCSAVKPDGAASVADLFEKKESPEVCGSVFALVEAEDKTDYRKVYLSAMESLVLNTKNDFELALALLLKENKSAVRKQGILNRIEKKLEPAETAAGENTIGLIGHSQLDNWQERNIGGYKVLNYGISGISSFEYYNYILKDERLKLTSDIYLVMHGINDVAGKRTAEEIYESIVRTFDYVRSRRPSARIFFICCAHVNGRLDRSNLRIDELNDYMLEHLPPDIVPIRLDEMDDEFGNLDISYTTDGLHFSEKGYEKLKEIVEEKIK